MKKNKFLIIILVIISVLSFKTALSDYYEYGSDEVTVTVTVPVVNCVGSWSNNSTCSASCGGGVLQQVYTITTPASGGGTACPNSTGDLRWGTTSCNTTACPVNCVGSWSNNSTCSASCGGGVLQQTYTITTPASGGGTACPYSNGATQWGTTSCNTTACPVNCVGSWNNNSTCSASCGGGVLQQTYTITTPASGGGTACSYTNGATRWGSTSCNTQSCPPASCSSPCGTIQDGYSCTAYAASSVTYPSSCSAQSRVCTDGSLSGSYAYSSCSVNSVVPTVSTLAVSSITQTSASSGGNITSNGGSTVTVSGIVWHVNANPTTSLYTGRKTDGAASGSWSDSMTGLVCGTTYHVRAYATNSVGTAYGSDVSFITSACASAPTVTTGSVTSINKDSATSGGSVTSNGGAAVTDAGIVWHISTNPTTSLYTGKISHPGWADYSSWSDNMTGLAPGTTYYVRAYATNSAGTSYGANVSFTTDNYSGEVTIYKNELKTFSFSGTDPDGDTVIYGVDFNNDGTVDSWTSPYTSSGTTMFSANSWPNIGTYYIRAQTKDSRGDVSNWSQLFRVNVIENPNPARITSFDVNKIKIDAGQSVILTWTSEYATSCSMTSSPAPSVSLSSLGAFTTNNNITFKPLKTTIYSLTCHGPGGDSAVSQKTVTVGKIKPTLNEF